MSVVFVEKASVDTPPSGYLTIADLSDELIKKDAAGVESYFVFSSAALTAGRVVFVGASGLDDDAAFVWDNVNKRLGIGITPRVPLEVYRDTTGSVAIFGRSLAGVRATIFMDDTAGSEYVSLYAYDEGASAYSTVYIGHATDTSLALIVDGTTGNVFAGGLSGTTGGSDLRYNTATDEIFYDTSAERYKENIIKAPESASDWLQNVPLKQFDRKDGSRMGEIGIIADELERVKPDMVAYNSDGVPEAYSKGDFVPYIILELQKINRRLDRTVKNG